MHFFWPKSFLFLVLIGFLVIALPLIAVLVSAEISMYRLADQGARTVLNSVSVTQESAKLVEQVVNLERMARQYSVLKDSQILSNLDGKQKELLTSLNTLERLMAATSQKEKLAAILRGVEALFGALQDAPGDDPMLKGVLDEFPLLNQLARGIHLESQNLIVRDIGHMMEASEVKRRDLILQAFFFICLTVVSIIVFSRLISRPIGEIDQGIRRLGEGDYGKPITVTGPKDLEFLGKRLDWLRERLGEVEKEKSRFLAHVSHELKTPLASIREGSELLSEELVGDLNEQQREVSKILCKNSIQLQKLIENLLGFSAEQAKLASLYYHRVNLEGIVEEVLEDQHPAILKKELNVETELEGPEFLGDRDRVRIVVDNLVSNAVKFTPAGGSILLKSFPQGSIGILEVADSGPGVPESEREKIFQPFYQGGTPSHGYIKGTGLGLSIVKEYVSEHGGQVFVGESQLGGALFRVSFLLDLQQQSV
ncbi:MAG: HAMP domain-containing histidine kinase [Deltaproteobacteria bacterium]|nr:HAMP domain-containing histidine kinase [Deltaproteobacteria bacterium]